MVHLLPPKAVAKLRAGRSVYHPDQRHNHPDEPQPQPYSHYLSALAHCRSCGEKMAAGSRVIAVDLFLPGTPGSVRRPTTVYLHPRPCCEDPGQLYAAQVRAWTEKKKQRKREMLITTTPFASTHREQRHERR